MIDLASLVWSYKIVSPLLKFIYSEKATKFCEISTLLLTVCTVDKSKVEISQNFVAFSEYTNFTNGSSCHKFRSHGSLKLHKCTTKTVLF